MAISSQYRSDTKVMRYDPTTIWLHWLTVGAIIILWLIGQTADWVPRGPFRTGLWSVHVVLGFFTGFMLLTRVAWRAHFGRVLPPADTGVLYAIAKATHYTLYALLGVVVVLGISDALYRGFNVFGVWSLPQVGSGNAATRHALSGWHELAANMTVAVACLHGAAAFVHQYVWRDHLLECMKP